MQPHTSLFLPTHAISPPQTHQSLQVGGRLCNVIQRWVTVVGRRKWPLDGLAPLSLALHADAAACYAVAVAAAAGLRQAVAAAVSTSYIAFAADALAADAALFLAFLFGGGKATPGVTGTRRAS